MFAWTYIRSKISIFNYQLPKYNLHLDIYSVNINIYIYIYIYISGVKKTFHSKKKPYNLMSNNSRKKF